MKKTLIMFAAALLMLTIVLSFAGCRKDPLKMEPAELEKYCSGLSAENFWKWYNGLTEEEQFKIDAMLFITDFVYPPDGSSSHIDATAVPNEPNEPEITPEPTPEPTPDPAVYREGKFIPTELFVADEEQFAGFEGKDHYFVKTADGRYFAWWYGVSLFGDVSSKYGPAPEKWNSSDPFYTDEGFGYKDANGIYYYWWYEYDQSAEPTRYYGFPEGAKLLLGSGTLWGGNRAAVVLVDGKAYVSLFDREDRIVEDHDNVPLAFVYENGDGDEAEYPEIEDYRDGTFILKDGRRLQGWFGYEESVFNIKAEYKLHSFDASQDTLIDTENIPYFYKRGGDTGRIWFEHESWGDYEQFPINMPAGHSTDDLKQILRIGCSHYDTAETYFRKIVLVFDDGELYIVTDNDLSALGIDPVKLEIPEKAVGHVSELFWNHDETLCALMDDGNIYFVYYKG